MSGSANEDHVQIIASDDPIEMCIDEVQARCRAPVAEEPRLHMLKFQRLSQQRILEEIDLANGYVVRGTPVGVHSGEFL